VEILVFYHHSIIYSRIVQQAIS